MLSIKHDVSNGWYNVDVVFYIFATNAEALVAWFFSQRERERESHEFIDRESYKEYFNTRQKNNNAASCVNASSLRFACNQLDLAV